MFDNVGSGSVFVVDIYQAFGGECCYAFVGRSGRRRCGCAGSDWGDKSGKGRIGRRKEEALVLIVDDNEDFVAFMKDSLSLYFSIQVAANGQEAWNVIPELKPDLIVSD